MKNELSSVIQVFRVNERGEKKEGGSEKDESISTLVRVEIF